jgi:hypothetical protein
VVGEAVDELRQVSAEAFEVEKDEAATIAADVVGIVAFEEA